jgi:hypothetical protein
MKKSSIKILTLLALVTMFLTSCLNDLQDYLGAFSSVPAVAEILDPLSPSTGLIVYQFVDPSKKITVKLHVNVAAPNLLKTDTKITLALDNALITAYNTAHTLTGLDAGIPVPAAALTIASYDVTIPAGTREALFEFTVDPTKIANPAALNIIPIKIASADNGVIVSGNYGTSLVQILGRNSFDGEYTVTGTFIDYVTASWTAWYPKTIHLITTSAYTCSRYDVGEDWDLYVFDTGGGALSGYGSWSPYFKFDASNNVIDVINTYAPVAPRNRKAHLYTGPDAVINKFDPVTKTLDVAYYLSQDDVVPVNRNKITEHYVYVKPRPE